MMQIQQQAVEWLCNRKKTVAVAESCTGGLVSAMLVDIPGASGCFGEGYVTYSNAAKEKNLGVRPETLRRFGAVSEQTAREMAEGARRRAGADYGLSTTGIAGPDGGTNEKPVGLVWLAVAGPDETRTKKCLFSGGREDIRTQAAQTVLALLMDAAKPQEETP